MQPCVSIFASKPHGTLFVGATSHVQKRIWEHKEGVVPGFSKRYGVKLLVYSEVHGTMDSALLREHRSRNGSGRGNLNW
jgi:putative endonuclease